jgi:hypothetical protein
MINKGTGMSTPVLMGRKKQRWFRRCPVKEEVGMSQFLVSAKPSW